MNTDKVLSLVPASLIALSLLLSGCAVEKIHTLGLNYIEAPGKNLEKPSKTIYIAPVLLSESIQDVNYAIGYWDRLNKQKDIYVLGETVTGTFKTGIVKALAERGYRAQAVEGWNLEPDQLVAFDENIIAFKVEQFETLSYSTPVKVESQFIIKLTGYLGVPSEYRVYSASVNLQSTPISVSISKEMVEKEFNELYSEAIRRVTEKLLEKIE